MVAAPSAALQFSDWVIGVTVNAFKEVIVTKLLVTQALPSFTVIVYIPGATLLIWDEVTLPFGFQVYVYGAGAFDTATVAEASVFPGHVAGVIELLIMGCGG
jgi:hypothetical protein